MSLDLDALQGWYARERRDLPWRAPGVGAYAVLVSEVMLQQTPVSRVLPAWRSWLERWPSPAHLAAASPADVLREWARLGYPRRALRLRECAVQVMQRFDGVVPSSVAELESLPGVGSYTARAVAVFAFGQRQPVVDTNVRRVVARAVLGRGQPGPPSARRDEAAVLALLPSDVARAGTVSIALMELGALVCTARVPRCAHCPLAASCAWVAAGSPAYDGPRARAQPFAGTDRQVRGVLLGVVRDSAVPVTRAALDGVWPDPPQRERALAALLADGLVVRHDDDTYALPV